MILVSLMKSEQQIQNILMIKQNLKKRTVMPIIDSRERPKKLFRMIL